MSSNKRFSAEKYRELYFISEEELIFLSQAGERIAEEQEIAFEEFAAWMEFHPNYSDYFDEQRRAAFSLFWVDLWVDLSRARLGEDFVQRQQQLANYALSERLPLEVYLSLLLSFQELIEGTFQRCELGTFELLRVLKKLEGICIFIGVEAYNAASIETISAQNETLKALSTPVTQIWDKILFLPLVGVMDSLRAQTAMAAMLQKIGYTQARAFILDISGIAAVDTAVANYLLKMSKASRLMGCLCILSGISPAVAETLVALGVDTNEIASTSNMQDALQKSFQLTQLKVVPHHV